MFSAGCLEEGDWQYGRRHHREERLRGEREDVEEFKP